MAPYLFTWLSHRWNWAELRDRYGRVGAAVLNLSGWHDEAYGPEGAPTHCPARFTRARRTTSFQRERVPDEVTRHVLDGLLVLERDCVAKVLALGVTAVLIGRP